jgi:hypothetical protein
MSDQLIVGFSRPNHTSVLASAIMWAEGTKFSHTYVRVYSASLERWLVYHASRTTLHFSNWPTIRAANVIVEEYAIDITPAQQTAILQHCIDVVDLPYAALQLAGMGLVRLCQKLGWRVSNPFRDGEKTQVCSELVGHVLQIVGADIKDCDLEVEGPRFIRDKVKGIGRLVGDVK